jgi:hypothetical protein
VRGADGDLDLPGAVVSRLKLQLVVDSILLTFKRSHVAAASIFFVGTGFPALIGLQQMSIAVGAAVQVASVNRRAS